eukprot:3801288-Rhodomonas_salina.2
MNASRDANPETGQLPRPQGGHCSTPIGTGDVISPSNTRTRPGFPGTRYPCRCLGIPDTQNRLSNHGGCTIAPTRSSNRVVVDCTTASRSTPVPGRVPVSYQGSIVCTGIHMHTRQDLIEQPGTRVPGYPGMVSGRTRNETGGLVACGRMQTKGTRVPVYGTGYAPGYLGGRREPKKKKRRTENYNSTH